MSLVVKWCGCVRASSSLSPWTGNLDTWSKQFERGQYTMGTESFPHTRGGMAHRRAQERGYKVTLEEGPSIQEGKKRGWIEK